MYSNRACLSEKNDFSQPLTVKSCGYYRTYTKPYGVSNRPNGRSDYQLIYVVSGKIHFTFDNKKQVLSAGHMVLYRPGEPQYYQRYAEDKPEAYWLHFSGNDVENILKNCSLSHGNVFKVGIHEDFKELFSKIITEIQRREAAFRKITALFLESILFLIFRYGLEDKTKNVDVDHDTTLMSNIHYEMSLAVAYFNEHYMENINIHEYAKSRNMSYAWFNRNFFRWVSLTPTQHIISARVASAQSLLESTDYSVAHIAELVGYNDPLYFSRVFKKKVGLSPNDWRKTRR